MSPQKPLRTFFAIAAVTIIMSVAIIQIPSEQTDAINGDMYSTDYGDGTGVNPFYGTLYAGIYCNSNTEWNLREDYLDLTDGKDIYIAWGTEVRLPLSLYTNEDVDYNWSECIQGTLFVTDDNGMYVLRGIADTVGVMDFNSFFVESQRFDFRIHIVPPFMYAQGTGSADDPYHSASPALGEAGATVSFGTTGYGGNTVYVKQGLEVFIGLGGTSVTCTIPEESGLSIANRMFYKVLQGTFDTPGTYTLTRTGEENYDLVTFVVLPSYATLDFLSDPSQGTITYVGN